MTEPRPGTPPAATADDRRRLLELLLEEQGIERTVRTIPRRGADGEVPLSYAQQRLWFLHQLDPQSPVYNVPTAVRLRGPVVPAAFARALAEVVRRHEVLRTVFPAEDGRPRQVIRSPGPVPLPAVDLSGLPAPARAARARVLVDVEARRPFDLGEGPLLRALLVRLADDEHALALDMHHIASDGWSAGVLERELGAHYRAFAAGGASPLPELPVQYADFAVWQRRELSGDTLEAHLDHWRGALASPPVLALPTDRPRRAVQRFRGARCSRRLPTRLARDLEDLGRRTEATPFMTLLAAFGALLGRCGRQQDVLIGSPIANRRPVETEQLIGYFANTLVLRVDLSGDPSFRRLQARVNPMVLAAYRHQDLPFEMLVDELEVERDLSHTPLFQAAFTLATRNRSGEGDGMPGLAVERFGTEVGTAKFDLTLQATDGPGGLHVGFEYNTDLFDATTVQRLLGHLGRLLEGVVADPDRRLSALPLLSPGEGHQVLREWGERTAGAGAGGSLDAAFLARAVAQPEAVAVSCGGTRLSYREVARRAAALAAELGSRGAAPGSFVGIAMARSADLVVAVVGVLRAGCAYVPLDPSYPGERLSYLASDSGARLVVTGGEGLPAALSGSAQEVPLAASVEGRAAVPGGVPGGGGAAYVIYTSGSTGRPKGVVVGHGNVLSLFGATAGAFAPGREDVWTLFHSYAFDFSVWEVWGALLNGGRVAVVPYVESRSPEAVWDLVVREGVTVLSQTPSAFRGLSRAAVGAGGGAGRLRWVVFGGEALELSSLRPWFEAFGEARPGLVNMYGITETTVHVTLRRVWARDAAGGTGSRIGRGIGSLDLYVAEGALAPAPVGVAGELYVGGGGVTRGYLGRPGLTASRFVPHPWSVAGGERLYRTGDLARWVADGDVEYLGRADSQVKVRGFRVEPGEIEASLVRHPGVAECAVVLREEPQGERRLVAYAVPVPGVSAGAGELRRWLSERLPEHMVPSAFVELPELPTTAHGKLDRRALPAPGGARPDLERPYVPPRNETEELLAGVWSHVLGLDRVGIHDGFFDLGGDSIRSVRALALARERGLDLTLQQLFQHQTIAGLAAAAPAGGASRPPRTSPFSLLAPGDRERLPEGLEDAYPLTQLQAGMLFHMRLAAADEPIYHNVDSMHLRARFDAGALQLSAQEVVDRHPMLRTSFDLTGYREPLQLVHRRARLPVPVEDLRHLGDAEQEEVIEAYRAEQRRRLFDLARPPLLRLYVHRRGDDSFQLTVTECHAIFDGWSLHATFDEIFKRYFARLEGAPLPPAPPLATTFRDFVALERAALESPEHQRFWAGQLQGLTVPELPRRPGRRRVERRRAVVLRRFGPEVVDGLKALARRSAVPLKSVLLAAHARTLSRITGSPDVLTGLSTHGRPEEVDGDQIRGLFLNLVPLRLTLKPCTWEELARGAFEAERALLPYRRYPMAAIQKMVPQRALLEVAFNYIHFHNVEDLARTGNLELLGFRKTENTHFTLVAHFRLDLTGSRLTLELEHDAGELTRPQVEVFARRYSEALAAMAATPDAAWTNAGLLSAAERHQVLREWNDTATAFPRQATIPELFGQVVEGRPEAVAVVAEAGTLTYGELDRRAAPLAGALRRLGVGPGDLVALFLERSLDLVQALVAILEAGAGYLALDRSSPPGRLARMLEGAGAAALLSRRSLAAELPGSELPTLWLEAPLPEGSASPEVLPDPLDVAYVAFTSGSTGEAKGVMVPHRAVVRLVRECTFARLDPGERLLHMAPVAFDASTLELWGALLNGARLVLAPPGPLSPGEVARTLERHRITTLWLTAGFFQVMADRYLGALGEVRQLLAGGDVLSVPHVRKVAAGGGCRLINGYGPTENTTFTCCHPVARGEEPAGSVPIGRPIGGTRVYLAGPGLDPVPVDAVGELLAGGDGLARGYLGRPGHTAERFVPDPFSGAPGERLYRTGDLVRPQPDGTLTFQGRIDRQVKIRGFRVELGEIEAVLLLHAAVAAAAAVVRSGDAEDRVVVAYLVPRPGGGTPAASELRDHARGELPEFMVPTDFVWLEELPLTPNGKLDRDALPAPGGPAATVAYRPPGSAMERLVAETWRDVLEVERVGREDTFFDLGGHSLALIRVHGLLQDAVGRELPLVALFDHPTVAAVARYLEAGGGVREDSNVPAPAPLPGPPAAAEAGEAAVAVVGMAGRFPGASDLEGFWSNLRDGVESITFFTDEELLEAGVGAEALADPSYVKANGVLEGAELFDAGLFGLNPREAQVVDPQHRQFLETAWEALEDAGCDPERSAETIGVFAGAGSNTYLFNLLSNREAVGAVGDFQMRIANKADFLATGVSYKLGLGGPSVTVQTACSTSLVAAHLACRALLNGECSMALAGGVSVAARQRVGYRYQEDGIVSPDGHCRAFDAAAQGTVGGNGVGVVVLKPLSRALADGDRVRAVILGSAVNNDGARRVGFTAPGVEGQARVIRKAQRAAGVAPETVTYVETHGSATALGDPIEVEALSQAFGPGRPGSCALGAVKTNVGHCDAAAGVAGLIKTVLALEHGQIPPSLHFRRPNPAIDFARTPFYVAAELADWDSEGPRRAGVSSFGMGGTNAHLVLQEAPPPSVREAAEAADRPRLLVLSARSPAALDAATDRLARRLEALPGCDLGDVAFTLMLGRRELEHRRALVAGSPAEAAAALGQRSPGMLTGVAERRDRPVAFLLSGVGDHYPAMGRGLYRSEPRFRRELDRTAELLEPHLGRDLRTLLGGEAEEEAPPAAGGGVDFRALARGGGGSGTGSPLDRTRFAQPAVFAVEVALARLLEAWGVRPESLLGYSLGEYTAAHLAGVLTLEDACLLVAARARLIDGLPGGAMLAVPLAQPDVEPLLGADLGLASINAPELCVVAGPEEPVAALEARLAAEGVPCRRTRASHAFHTRWMEPAVGELREIFARVRLQPPRTPYLSNVTGTWITAEEATDPDYWVEHLCRPVRFGPALEELFAGGERLLLEVGPGQALTSAARQHPARPQGVAAVAALRHARERRDDRDHLLTALGRLWLAGARPDWRGLYAGEERRRVALPTYPFQRQRYYVERRGDFLAGAAATREVRKQSDLGRWFYVPTFRPAPPVPLEPAAPGGGDHWLVLAGTSGLAADLARSLEARGCRVTLVEAGGEVPVAGNGSLSFDPTRSEDYERLLAELVDAGQPPRGIVHALGLGQADPQAPMEERFAAAQELGLYSLVHLGRALAGRAAGERVALTVLTAGAQAVSPSEVLRPERTTVLAAARVLTQEYPDVTCRTVDLEIPVGPRERAVLVRQLTAEVVGETTDLAGAYRRNRRWVQGYERLPLGAGEGGTLRELRRGGVYLIVGGLGRVGMLLAGGLARAFGARVVLTGRSDFPPREAWGRWVEERGEGDAVSRKIRRLQELEASGGEVHTLVADAADETAMQRLLAEVDRRFGALHGVFYTAGATGRETFSVLAETDRAACEVHFRSKVHGLQVLEGVLEGRDLDFCLLFSSISSVLGGLGFTAYAAANAFMDAFTHEHNRRGAGVPWLCSDWDGWRMPGEAAGDGFGGSVAELAMTPDEGLEACRRLLLGVAEGQVVVSTADLEARIDRWLRPQPEGPGEAAPSADTYARPDLPNPYLAPRDATEETIAGFLRDLFAISEIGAHDSFFDLGGNSLLATQLLSRLRREFKVEVSLRELFESPTVAGLTAVVEGRGEERDQQAEVAALLAEIEGLTAEQLEEELARRTETNPGGES